MTSGQPQPGLPDHEQRAWEAIVADLRRGIPTESDGGSEPGGDGGTPGDGADTLDDDDDELLDENDDEGFVPPEPPPIPRPEDAIGRFSWAAALGGLLLIVLATAIGLDRWLATLGVFLAVGGFVSLLWRMKDREDGDDGAVV